MEHIAGLKSIVAYVNWKVERRLKETIKIGKQRTPIFAFEEKPPRTGYDKKCCNTH